MLSCAMPVVVLAPHSEGETGPIFYVEILTWFSPMNFLSIFVKALVGIQLDMAVVPRFCIMRDLKQMGNGFFY